MLEIQSEERRALRTALVVSSCRKSSIYNLGNSDRENGYYFIFAGLEVPFKAVLMDNSKVKGINSIAFGTAKDCPSLARGLCQLPDNRVCYARAGESRATKKDNGDGSKGMDSYWKGVLCSEFWDLYESDRTVRDSFHGYLWSKGISCLRFNLKGDFRHESDILAIWTLASEGFHMVGYTARDDLASLEGLGNHPKVTLNGSNRMYTNRFKCTDSLEEFLNCSLPCLGACSTCRKCYTLRNKEITVLVHGNGSDTLLNTPENRELVLAWSREALPWDVLRDTDFEACKGLVACLDKELAKIGVGLRFKNAKNLIAHMRAWRK